MCLDATTDFHFVVVTTKRIHGFVAPERLVKQDSISRGYDLELCLVFLQTFDPLEEATDLTRWTKRYLDEFSRNSAAFAEGALIMGEPISMGEGEMTAKGNLNFAKILQRRAELVERLFDDADAAGVGRIIEATTPAQIQTARVKRAVLSFQV